MDIQEARKKHKGHTISYLPKKDYLIGITPDNPKLPRSKYEYNNVYLARKDDKHYLLYPEDSSFTGHFESREKAINWFKNGGR